MKYIFYPLFLSVLVCACGGQDRTASANSAADTAINSTGTYAAASNEPFPPLPACYININGEDSMLLRLRNLMGDGEISGDLDFRTKKKEPNNGTFFGKMKGDTLIANYSYLQKGKRKIKEVAFVRHGNEWIEGSGPSAELGGVRRFSDISRIEYRGGVYRQASCQ
jgi:hypothetical protein